MKKLGKKILWYALGFLATFVVVNIVSTYFSEGVLRFSRDSLGMSLGLAFVVVAVILVSTLMKNIDKIGSSGDKAKDEARDARGNKVQEFFNSDFVTLDELRKNSAFNYHNMNTIRSSKKDGVLVRADYTGHNMDINFVEPIHTLVVGTTSSGKTTRFVVPTIQLMSMTAAKPSFVVTDPKGELYDKNYNKLVKEGYQVFNVDLIKPFQSTRWNPLSYPYDAYHRSFNLDKEVKVHPPGDNPKKYNLIIQREFDYNQSTWFEFNKIAYVDKQALETDMRVIARELQTQVQTAVQDICETMCPVAGDKDPSWKETAQKLLQAIIFGMLEDSRIPELNLTRDKFCFYNVAKIVNTQDGGRDTFATLKKYLFEYRDKFTNINDLANTALNNAEGTSKNYVGFATAAMALFSDMGISFLTGDTEIDFVNMDEKPTAIFLLIPDEIKTRHPLAISFVTQLYKRLVEKARSMPNQRLKRNVYFLLDEFGNMPAFPNMGNLISVGRSRGIFFELVVQSYSQLYSVYGDKEGKIIKDNCPIQVYIATEDMQTNKEFSELLGKKTITKTTVNTSKGPDGKKTESYSDQTVSVPIAHPEELMKFRDKGEIIIKTFTPNAALKTKITPYFKCPLYDASTRSSGYMPRRIFEEDQIYYDIKERNRIMAKNNDDDDDDDDDLF